jgi:hypothetical protein
MRAPTRLGSVERPGTTNMFFSGVTLALWPQVESTLHTVTLLQLVVKCPRWRILTTQSSGMSARWSV